MQEKSNFDEKIKNIWRECFRDSEEEIDFYFKNLYDEKNLVYIDENNIIKSCLHENKYDVILNKENIKSSFIVAVGVLPEYRKKGYMKKLIDKTFSHDYDFIYLHPVNSSIYEKYSFSYISDLEEYYLEFDDIKDYIFDKNINIEKANHENIKDLIEIYNASMKNYFSFVKRNDKNFINLYKEVKSDSGETYIFYEESHPMGYVIFYKNEDIVVREIFSKNSKILKNILSFLKTFKDYYNKIKFILPKDSHFEYFLENKNKLDKKIKPYIMGRILNVKNILLKLDINFRLKIKIIDDYIKENNKIFEIYKDEIKILDDLEDYDIEIDIASLTSLIFGYIDIENLIFLEKIKFKNEIIKNKIFSKKRVYFQDYQ